MPLVDTEQESAHAELTILLPYFNEAGWLGRTIDSLAVQTDARFRIILIDNASTDGSNREAHKHADRLGQRAQFLLVAEPGKTQALAAGLRQVRTPCIATCDADTIYPPDYVANMLALFAAYPRNVAVFAIDLYAEADAPASLRRVIHILRKARWQPGHCHAGGYAQAFRTDVLRSAGGFDPARWPYVLEDHEIASRIQRFGMVRYHPAHVCHPSERRKSRCRVSWSRFEKLVYRLTPGPALDWYFHSFLAPRLKARGSHAQALREKSWEAPATSGA
jgi:glycosyltransferase involved in cell wall biosynthesis